jgi:hypothetical protein
MTDPKIPSPRETPTETTPCEECGHVEADHGERLGGKVNGRGGPCHWVNAAGEPCECIEYVPRAPASPPPSPHGDDGGWARLHSLGKILLDYRATPKAIPEVRWEELRLAVALAERKLWPSPAPTTERAAATPGAECYCDPDNEADESGHIGCGCCGAAPGERCRGHEVIVGNTSGDSGPFYGPCPKCSAPEATPAATPDPTEAGPSWGEIAEKADGYATHMATADGLRSAMRILAENIRCALRRARRGQ